MKTLIIYIIFHGIPIIHNQFNDYRIIGSKGESLPLYLGLYYSISNKYNGNYWIKDHDMVSSVDPRNGSHWWQFELIRNNFYKLGPREGINNKYYFVYSGDDYYRIIEAEGIFAGEAIVNTEGFWKNGETYRTSGVCRWCPNTPISHAQWKFEEMPDYKLLAIMSDFQYEIPLQEVINLHIKRVDLLETSVLTNDSPAKIEQDVTNEVKKKQTFVITYSNSIATSSRYFFKFEFHGEVSAKFYGIGASASTDTEFSMELNYTSNTTNSNSQTESKEVTYKIKKTVEVPPYEKVQVFSYLNWIDNLMLPYKAKVTVTGIAPRFEDNSCLGSQTIKLLLNKYGFSEKLIADSGTSLTFEVKGMITGSFGLDSVLSVTSLGKLGDITINSHTLPDLQTQNPPNYPTFLTQYPLYPYTPIPLPNTHSNNAYNTTINLYFYLLLIFVLRYTLSS